ncbi:MAG: methylase [Gallionellales bacterium 35-53-114]|jgi:methylase of polypeptide subunit release factors|nr:MAG: methylase [Gallionellales bacterium 35-53-114]OYZ63120.1 MAG: methylase [Gallionellales bacterium 24-53-125]OZB08900.1 MAG: methylase [Gallionellales bacterium 39-52-133]HQS59430.1 class I SAM-dependent methyltransferase [Gallionellaceae bacterium]HQS76343.1 class I SAM-dependent methyltransferase [Gallionellaceae bacterium]
MSDHHLIHWSESGTEQSARWRSESGTPAPKRVILADDTIKADHAHHLASEGTALLWCGDYQNAKQLLQAIARRIDAKADARKPAADITAAFHQYRQTQIQRAKILGMLLIPCNADHTIPLRRAPDCQQACSEVYGEAHETYVISLRELQGLIGAHEWRKKGVEIPALGARIHPHYGVFSPIRGEYLELVAHAPLPEALTQNASAFDIGTGTGVLAAILAKRGVQHIVATDQNARALTCATENITRLGYSKQIQIVQADLYPQGQAALIVCNPPWLPARPSSALEAAVYDPDSSMLRGFLNGLAAHLAPHGEGWLIMSDLAELLGLRGKDELSAMITNAGLKVLDKIDTKPQHARAADASDPLHAARKAETTSLWRLTKNN